MSKTKPYDTFCLTLQPDKMSQEDWDNFSTLMNRVQDSYEEDIRRIQEEYSVSYSCAGAIWYLRSRSRWTEEKEQQLVDIDRRGGSMPNVMSGEF